MARAPASPDHSNVLPLPPTNQGLEAENQHPLEKPPEKKRATDKGKKKKKKQKVKKKLEAEKRSWEWFAQPTLAPTIHPWLLL